MTGDQLRIQRKVAHLSQEGLAKRLEVSSRTIRRYERHGKTALRPIVVRALSQAIQEALRAQNRGQK